MSVFRFLTGPGVAMIGLIPLAAQAGNEDLYGGIGISHSGFVIDQGSATKERDQSTTSAGLYIGYKKNFTNGFFLTGEGFYNDTSIDETFRNGDSVSLDSQYGIKAHIGYEWDWGGTLYGILGAAHYGYDIKINAETTKENRFEQLYGAGIGYRFNDAIATHLEVTATGDEIDLEGEEDIDAGLVLIRFGISYFF